MKNKSPEHKAAHKLEVALTKVNAKSREGNFYVKTGNISNAGVSHQTLTKIRTSSVLIGKSWENRNDYENKLSRRATMSGIKRKKMQGINEHSLNIQFPSSEKLADGRDKYYVKHGVVLARN